MTEIDLKKWVSRSETINIRVRPDIKEAFCSWAGYGVAWSMADVFEDLVYFLNRDLGEEGVGKMLFPPHRDRESLHIKLEYTDEVLQVINHARRGNVKNQK